MMKDKTGERPVYYFDDFEYEEVDEIAWDIGCQVYRVRPDPFGPAGNTDKVTLRVVSGMIQAPPDWDSKFDLPKARSR